MEKNNETVFCSKCGHKNSSSDKFCSNCGTNLKSIENSIKDATTNIKDTITNNETYKKFTDISGDGSLKADWENDDMINFIQKNTEYYIPKFKEMQDLEKSTSWNWASFFLTSNWLFYRKMYGYGVGLIIANIIFAFIPFLGWFLNIGTYIVCGLYGNSLYLKHVQKQLSSVDGLKEDIKHRVLLSKGGTNLVLPIVLTFLVPILLFILAFFGLTLSIMSSPYYY
ncbi:zinc-ribbon domain-containing protein [Paraclostridium bifermentans]|uniref:zinc-ribbon domain-containing protein n=1 Tax=Paraclostridium bifermentans TaxID=1490 RepID=UPI001C81C797|nr:zinc-ribbon domain-containing protein [Paraclostridium bifermentans]GIM32344.1 hypothetical protein PAGU1678_16140 [Paraclostridium bifermentans subsp. muricolitidis]